MLIFSYGSNMCLTRLNERVHSVKFISVAKLYGHKIKLHKVSKDGSAKANAYETADTSDFILGVIFQINDKKKAELDEAEGLGHGYSEKNVTLVLPDNSRVSAQVYFANENAINDLLIPYSWYMDFIIVGAEDFQFSNYYISELRNIETMHDYNEIRRQRNESILAGHVNR